MLYFSKAQYPDAKIAWDDMLVFLTAAIFSS